MSFPPVGEWLRAKFAKLSKDLLGGIKGRVLSGPPYLSRQRWRAVIRSRATFLSPLRLGLLSAPWRLAAVPLLAMWFLLTAAWRRGRIVGARLR